MEKHIYRYLQGLKDSDFKIVDGEPNIIGWKVKSDMETHIGEIKDLLFDPESRSVRYLIIDLEDNGMNLGDKKVMVPIGTAHLHTSDDEVVLPNITTQQLADLPAFNENATVPATEVHIAHVFDSDVDRNETQRERAIAEFNQSEFYQHENFNKDRFYQRGGLNNTTPEQNTSPNLTEGDTAKTAGTSPEYNEKSDQNNLDGFSEKNKPLF